MTETAIAESETGMDEVQRFQMVEDMVIHHHPEWQYLVNTTLPVRPATEEEQAAYKARYDATDWHEIYQPDEPLIILPPTDEVAELTEIAAGALEAPPAVDDETASEQARQEAVTALARWTKGTKLADPETARPDPDAELVEGTVVDDPATTRFLEAFAEDPEGEKDRAQPPGAPEVHHDGTHVIDMSEGDAS